MYVRLFVYLISGDTDYRSANMPIILPLILTTALSLSCTALTYVPQEECLYITFILFTIFRSYLFSFEVTFINDRYVLQIDYITSGIPVMRLGEKHSVIVCRVLDFGLKGHVF